MARTYDIVLFGATGFTGRYLIPYMAKFIKLNAIHLKWAVAARSETKLRQIINDLEPQYGISFRNIPIIIANIDEPKTLEAMARKTRLLISCCGPFRLMGEPVVKACVKEGTHYIDVAGEPEFMELIQLKYAKRAEEKSIYLISSCGFDSIPVDLGVIFMQEKFNGTLNSVKTYLDGHFNSALPGASFNKATWESAVHGVAGMDNLIEIRKKLYSVRLPRFTPKLKFKMYPHKAKEAEGHWASILPVADKSVVYRTQRYLYESESIRPCQIETFVSRKSIIGTLVLFCICMGLLLLSKFKWGKRLLLKYPEVFSIGIFSHKEPSFEKSDSFHFIMYIYGEGWKEKVDHPVENDLHKRRLNKTMTVQIRGKNPAYYTTAVCCIFSALVLLTETDKLPSMGGVYTPGAAFRKTSLIEKLHANGITFEVMHDKDL